MTTPLPEALTRIQIVSEDREQRVPRVRHLIEFRHGDEVLAALESEAAPIHTPSKGDALDLYGVPATVTGVTVLYDTAPDGLGVVLAVVTVTPADRPAVAPIPGMPSRITGAYEPNVERDAPRCTVSTPPARCGHCENCGEAAYLASLYARPEELARHLARGLDI
ncbi:hypothetical protein ABZX72_29495 [Streptomyces cyaneofuscatus]|uniref:hypothetical protein n=1 Tax=Streptomyces cyaneofuscatus TaxID=66883 RepID=UPI0033B3606C